MNNTFSKIMMVSMIGMTAQIAVAATPLKLTSDVFVERQHKRADGSVATVLEQPKLVVPGDNLVFVVKYKNIGSTPATNFSVTNPLPNAVAFNGTSDGRELVSVDGGKSWGALGALQLKASDGRFRPARMTDVTHIKWNLNKSLSAGSEGKLMFRGVVK
jgi:uncharacterized repeat protein (TIGR01451 family)